MKRVVAVADQEVDLRDGDLCVDGVPLCEPYAVGRTFALDGSALACPHVVAVGCVWVMGDNRTNSADSRYFGPIAEESITGHVCFIYWPLNRAGVLG